VWQHYYRKSETEEEMEELAHNLESFHIRTFNQQKTFTNEERLITLTRYFKQCMKILQLDRNPKIRQKLH
jgi:hypothetical protein